jgi:hypothetical protein
MADAILTFDLEGRQVTVRVRPQVTNLLLGDEAPSYSFDLAGRLIGAFVDGKNYRRGLDNRVMQKWPGPGGARQRRWLAPGEAQKFLEDAYWLAAEAARAVLAQPEGRAYPRLEAFGRWDWAALEADAARFAQVYRPISILPPDQYLALVLQTSEGCSYNRCTFCSFYRDRPFRIKSAEQLREHIIAVREFFGPAIALRKSLFLADANALVAPMARLRAWLDVIQGSFPRTDLYSFMDAFDVHRKSACEWAELAQRGLRRVYIGLESGDDALLRFLQKPGSVADAVSAVTTLKRAGISASVIVMTGIGGDRYAADHTVRTVTALNAMPLSSGDIIYFSPFVEHAGSEYSQLSRQAGIHPLNEAEIAQQEAAIRARLSPGDPAHLPKCSRYDVQEFVY